MHSFAGIIHVPARIDMPPSFAFGGSGQFPSAVIARRKQTVFFCSVLVEVSSHRKFKMALGAGL
jgi:hypothetical protein